MTRETRDSIVWGILFYAVAAALLFLFARKADGAVMGPIPGWRPSINWTGFDPGPNGDGSGSFTYVPIKDGAFKPEYAAIVATLLAPEVGRSMDLLQGQTNDEATWPGRASTDFGRNGITRETDIRIANQMRALSPGYVPQTTIPERADDDYARRLGRLWGAMYAGNVVRVNLGNEIWNVFKGNNGEYALIQARAAGFQGDDLTALAQWQGRRLAQTVFQMKLGLADAGRTDVQVIPIVEGFAPVTSYAANQLKGMKDAGFDPAAMGARLAIAQYAFGSATDVGGRPTGTAAEKRDAVLDFVNDSLIPWTAAHLALAKANGLAPFVDAYEMRLATKPAPNGSQELADWVAFQLTDENAQAQDAGIRALLAAAGGIGANLDVEGYGGFPMYAPQGQFPLVDMDPVSMFVNPGLWGSFRGVQGLIDYSTVPDPVNGLLGGLAGILWAAFKRERTEPGEGRN